MKEHCVLYGCDISFVTSNYKVTTTPKFEWTLIVKGQSEIVTLKKTQQLYEKMEVNMEHERRIPIISELLTDPKCKVLRKEEVIAVVMYTGPMVLCL